MPIEEFKFRIMMTLSIIGLSISVIVLIRAFAARLLTLRWHRTEAHVLDVRDTVWVVPGVVSGAVTGIRAHYAYLVGGKRYEARRVSPHDRGLPSGPHGSA